MMLGDLLAEVGVPDVARSAMTTWLDLVKTWNARIDLTAAKTDRDLVDLMVADALVLSKEIDRDLRVVDVGTGAGAPGLALAILRPDLVVTLVEPLAKRVSFVRTVIGTLGRTDITLTRAKGEDAIATPRPFDVAISRATLNPPAWVPLGLQLAPVVWTLLAREEPPQLAAAAVDRDIPYTWPLGGNSRRAVRHVLQLPT